MFAKYHPFSHCCMTPRQRQMNRYSLYKLCSYIPLHRVIQDKCLFRWSVPQISSDWPFCRRCATSPFLYCSVVLPSTFSVFSGNVTICILVSDRIPGINGTVIIAVFDIPFAINIFSTYTSNLHHHFQKPHPYCCSMIFR